jgi:hypothetical protein
VKIALREGDLDARFFERGLTDVGVRQRNSSALAAFSATSGRT